MSVFLPAPQPVGKMKESSEKSVFANTDVMMTCDIQRMVSFNGIVSLLKLYTSTPWGWCTIQSYSCVTMGH